MHGWQLEMRNLDYFRYRRGSTITEITAHAWACNLTLTTGLNTLLRVHGFSYIQCKDEVERIYNALDKAYEMFSQYEGVAYAELEEITV
ncbi:hypothetical protein [Pseudomonas phage pPA-3099-2aT.2]|uniref:Uncharacterized protein n=1 Tax=Pseudomonas phage pPA-3099-2aT.2 TaxID=3003808 RepID=A0AAE9W515_9CAUD|nr:hypothetical protein QE325_gp138 [Pseudomonas phage pPA-3099-2aT.2]WBQ35243.1 hypothetical protein [Pseudomonas phage pPA-3099-2aT.2]